MNLFVINLKERTDRKHQIIQDFKPYKNIQLHFIEAIRNTNGAIGCFLSHKKCVEIAKEKNMEYVIVLEDDCLPMENFENRLINILEFLSSYKEWDLFLGGVKRCNRILEKYDIPNDILCRIKRGHSTHLVIYHKTIYDFVLHADETKDAVDTFWHGKYMTLVALPFVAYQRNGFTDIGKCYNSTLIDTYNNTQNYLLGLIK
jgi:hypothetical protein